LPGPRIVTLDIETAPLVSYHWGIHDENIGLDQVREDWSILAFAYKVLGKKRVYFFSTGGRGAAKVRDDRKLLRELWAVLDRADIVVTQNGKRFDLKKIRSRMIQAGMKPFSEPRHIDTWEHAHREFSFTSTKLAWTSKLLTKTPKSEHKKFPGFSLWAECLRDNRAAWREMRQYNIRDVEATELLYLKMRPWIKNHPNVGVYIADEDKPRCPKCGSANLNSRGYGMNQTGVYYRLQCRKCGGWSRTRRSLARPYSRHLLAN
jgi:DNA polymerase elongation subunit (family B)